MIDKKVLWEILKNEHTLPDTLKIMGFPQEEIDNLRKNRMTDIFDLSLFIKQNTYNALFEMGEVEKDKVYNLTNNDYSNPDREMDIGIMDNTIYYGQDGKWKLYYSFAKIM